ncbi:MAG: hypothetical protein U0610_10695 [bacterium]
MSNWDRRFAVAISVELTSGKSSVGSGYAIAPNLILTARHVARPAKAKADATPYVHLVNLDRSKHPARLRWAPTTDEDIALLEVEHVIDEKLTPGRSWPPTRSTLWVTGKQRAFPRCDRQRGPARPAPFEGRIHPSVPRRPQLLLDGVVAREPGRLGRHVWCRCFRRGTPRWGGEAHPTWEDAQSQPRGYSYPGFSATPSFERFSAIPERAGWHSSSVR